MRQKRVLAIHDISGVGKCSLTVALPIISAAGIECSIIPTAVLSTHTGGFENYTYKDLTEEIDKIVAHWKTLNIKFDAIYTGYLGSYEQLDIVSNAIKALKDDDTIIIVDPVMADHGELYASFEKDFPSGMAGFSKNANILIPNITEACFILDKEYKEGPYSKEFIEDLLKSLAELGPKKIILTGVHFDNEQLGVGIYDKDKDQITYICDKKIEGYYHGTGDIFGSAFTASYLSGLSLEDSVESAIFLVTNSINRTIEAGTERKYGVHFEEFLFDYMKFVKNKL